MNHFACVPQTAMDRARVIHPQQGLFSWQKSLSYRTDVTTAEELEDTAPGAVDKASKTLQGHAGRILEDPPCAFKLNRPG
jgi:hypothetical protein